MIEILKIIFCLSFLLYSCYPNIKEGRVPNRVWSIMLLSNAIFVLFELLTFGISYFFHLLISFVVTFALAYVLFQLNIFGGAPAKALIVLSIVISRYPVIQIKDYLLPILGVPNYDFFAIGVLANSIILILLLYLSIFIYNLFNFNIEILRNPIRTLSGYSFPAMLLITVSFIITILFGDFILFVLNFII